MHDTTTIVISTHYTNTAHSRTASTMIIYLEKIFYFISCWQADGQRPYHDLDYVSNVFEFEFVCIFVLFYDNYLLIAFVGIFQPHKEIVIEKHYNLNVSSVL